MWSPQIFVEDRRKSTIKQGAEIKESSGIQNLNPWRLMWRTYI